MTDAVSVRLAGRQAAVLLAKKHGDGQYGQDLEIMILRQCIEDVRFAELAADKLDAWRNKP